jgi:transcriptional regulator with XRE-family HTH domain
MIASIEWTSQRVRRLRGKRTQAEFGRLVGVPKNTVWRWEAGYARPDAQRAARLSRLAKKERFLAHWELAGSAELLGDIEEGSKILRERFRLV